MIYPALDATTEHIYINLGANIGNGSGTSRVNAKGYVSLSTYFTSVASYDMVTNKRHRVVHVVGVDTSKDTRMYDAGAPSTMVNQDYFYDIFYETDVNYGSVGFAHPFIRIFNFRCTVLAHGSSSATSKQFYINPRIESAISSASVSPLTIYSPGYNTKGKIFLINPLLINTGTQFKLFRCTTANAERELYFYGGAIIAKNQTGVKLIDITSGSGEKVYFNNTAFHLGNAATDFVTYNGTYTAGALEPRVEANNCTFNSPSLLNNAHFFRNNCVFGALADDVFTDYANNNFVATNGIYNDSGLDLTTYPDYGWTDYPNWNIGLRVAEPLPGALSVDSFTSASGTNTMRGGDTVTIETTGDIGASAGTIVLKNVTQTAQITLTVTDWNSATGVVVATVPNSYALRFNDANNLLFINRADTEPFAAFGSVTFLAPIGVQTILGENPDIGPASVFFGASQVPTAGYQIQWTDPQSTGATIDDRGVIGSVTQSGSINVRVYDESDLSISTAVNFVVNTDTNPSIISVNNGDPLTAGNNSLSLSNIAPTAIEIDDIAMTNVSALGFTLPTFQVGAIYPRFGDNTLTVFEGIDEYTAAVVIAPPTGRNVVSLTSVGAGASNASAFFTIATNDQLILETPEAIGTATHSVSVDGTFTTTVFGPFTVLRRNNVTGMVTSHSVTINAHVVVPGRRTIDRNITALITPSAESPRLDSREPTGRPNGFRVYGTSVGNKKFYTVRSKTPLFGTKAIASPIIWWNGRDVYEYGVRKTDYDAVVAGTQVPNGPESVFTSAAFPSITFDSDVRYPGQEVSVRINRGEYFGRPRAQLSNTPFTGTFISWRCKTDVGMPDFEAYRFVSVTGTFTPGEDLIINSDGVTIDDGTAVFRSLEYGADPRFQIRNTNNNLVYGNLSFTGKTSGAVCTVGDNTRYRYKGLTGTAQVGNPVTIYDHDGVAWEGGVTITAIDTVSLVLTLSGVPAGMDRNNVSSYLTTIVDKTTGAVFDFGNKFEATGSGKLYRFNAGVVDYDRPHSVASEHRFWLARASGVVDDRFFEEGEGGADAGYFNDYTPNGKGTWELIEVVHNYHNPGNNLGHGYIAFNGNERRKYSNGVYLDNINFNNMRELICFGNDGTGGANQVAFDARVNELYYDSSLQRAVLSNSATYKAAGKNVEFQLPVKWTPYEVTFLSNTGALDLQQPLYLYVIDEKDYVNGVNVNSYENVADVNGIPFTLV